MTVFQAVVLGLVQGLGEFLPISSSAHLALVPWLLGWQDPGLAFDVALHVGTLLAVLVYFRREWLQLIRAGLRIVARRRIENAEERRVLFLVVATIPGVIAGKLLQHQAESAFRSPILIAGALIVMGVVLWLVDRARPEQRDLDAMQLREAVLIGLSQVAALVPGVSRSGSTITAGRALGFDRRSAAVFSFLMSMPIIAGAAVLEMPAAIRQSGLSAPLIAGIAAAALSGWLAITVLLRFVVRHSYGVFALYRLVLGVIVIVIALARGG